MPILDDIFEKPIIADGVIGDILKPKPPTPKQPKKPKDTESSINAEIAKRVLFGPALSDDDLQGYRERIERINMSRAGMAILFAKDNGWVTIGGNKSAPKGEKGGTPVYLEDGKVAKGPASLKGRDVDNLQDKERHGPPKPPEKKPKSATIKIKKAKGYKSYGSLGQPSYLAKITGFEQTKDGKDFARSYEKTENIDWGDSELYKKSKGTWTEIHSVGDGVYEANNHGEYDYYFIVNGEKFEPSGKDLRWMAQQLSDGRSFSDCIKVSGDKYDLIEKPSTWEDVYNLADVVDGVKAYDRANDNGMVIEFDSGEEKTFKTPKDAMDYLKPDA